MQIIMGQPPIPMSADLEGMGSSPAHAGIDFVQVEWPHPLQFAEFTLLAAWQWYIEERCRRLGQEVNRVQYVAKHWLRIMDPFSLPGTWKIADVQRYESVRRAEGAKGTTIRRELCLMQAALNHNLRRERIERVPHFEKPNDAPAKRRPMTPQEFKRLMAVPMPRRIRLFFLVAYWTGHRARAIETLPWSRVDLVNGTIDFNDPAMRRTNKRRVDGFPIPDELLPRLVAAKAYRDAKCPDDPYVIGLSPKGTLSTTYHECKKALRAAGIDEKGLCRHTLRKTFVTERIKAGANAEKVAALIADNPQTMRKHYSVLLTNDLRATANLH